MLGLRIFRVGILGFVFKVDDSSVREVGGIVFDRKLINKCKLFCYVYYI